MSFASVSRVADYCVFEMKTIADVARSVGASHEPIRPGLTTDD